MYIECDHCQAGYDLEIPAAALSGGRSVKFRCTSCGHSFHVVKNGERVAESVRPAAARPVVERALQHVLLRQEGVSYHVPDVATLQRWIVERRVAADDELDFGEGRWVRAGDRPDLAPFFAIVHEAETGSVAAFPDLPADDPTEMAEPASLLPAAALDAAAPQPVPSESPKVEPDAHGSDTDPGAAEATPAPAAAPAPVPESPKAGAAAPQPDVASEPADAAAWDVPSVWESPPSEGGAVPSVWESPPSEGEAEASIPASVVGEDPPLPSAELEHSSVDLETELVGPDDLKPAARSGSDDTLSDGLVTPFVAADGAGLDAPDPLGLSPESGEDAPAWADQLFDDAPVPGVRPPSADFESSGILGDSGDEPTESVSRSPELIEDEGLGLDAADLSHGAAPDVDAVSHQDDESDWFEKGGSKPAFVPKTRKDGSGGWLVAAIIVVAIVLLAWMSDSSGPEPEGGLDGRGLEVEGAPVVKTGGEGQAPATEPSATEPGAEGDASPAGEGGEDGKSTSEEAGEPAAGADTPADGDEEASTAAGSSEGGTEDAAGAKESAAATPAPAASAPKTSSRNSADRLVDRGWGAVDRGRLADAEKHFRDALKIRDNHADAHFGLGYVTERQGKVDAAVASYCRARSYAGGNVGVRREVDGRLSVLGRSCP